MGVETLIRSLTNPQERILKLVKARGTAPKRTYDSELEQALYMMARGLPPYGQIDIKILKEYYYGYRIEVRDGRLAYLRKEHFRADYKWPYKSSLGINRCYRLSNSQSMGFKIEKELMPNESNRI